VAYDEHRNLGTVFAIVPNLMDKIISRNTEKVPGTYLLCFEIVQLQAAELRGPVNGPSLVRWGSKVIPTNRTG